MSDGNHKVRRYKRDMRTDYQNGLLTTAHIERLHAIGFFPEIPVSDYKIVVCYETGEEFPSIGAAAESIGLCDNSIFMAATHGYSVGGYHWYYKYKGEPRTSELKGNKHKTIECIETGEVFRSITEAARKYGTAQNTISEALKNDYALFGRYHFRYIATSDSKMRTVKEKRKMLRQVVNLETGKRFNSVREAAEVTGYSTGSFYPVLRCTARKLGGHHWMYADEYDLLSKEEIAHIVKHGGRDDL